jgi:hypothetical protein
VLVCCLSWREHSPRRRAFQTNDDHGEELHNLRSNYWGFQIRPLGVKQATPWCVTDITAAFHETPQVTVVTSDHRSPSNATEKSHDQSKC